MSGPDENLLPPHGNYAELRPYQKLLRWLGIALLAGCVLLATAWTFGALYYDGPSRVLAVVVAIAMLAGWVVVRRPWLKGGIFAGGFVLVLGWWLALKPTLDADWQPDVAQLPWAEITGDEVIVHNVRNSEYRSETDFTPHWETRKLRLSDLTGVDMAVTYWGSPWIAHPIMSFQFRGSPPLCFSIETRKKVGQGYSTIAGLYRQYELIYIAADERDVLRLRSNYRHGEEVYLYRTTLSADQARQRLLEYFATINRLRNQPRWYHALVTNCTTTIRQQHPVDQRMPWDWRLLLNGKGDEMMYEHGAIATAGLPFAELKRRVLINPAARAANDASDFSARIRQNCPGMTP